MCSVMNSTLDELIERFYPPDAPLFVCETDEP